MSDISTNEDRGDNPGHGQGKDADLLAGEVESARDKVGEAAEAIRDEAADFAEAAKDKASETIEASKETLATAVGDFADAIRTAGETLAEKDQTVIARLVMQAADGLGTFSRAAAEKSPEEMLTVIRSFGRSNPTAFLAGSVLAGVALGRFARSSGSHDHHLEKAPRPSGFASTGFPLGQETHRAEGLVDAPIAAADLNVESAPMTEPVGLGVLGETPADDKFSRTGI